MVMSLMENFVNVKRKSKLWQIPLITWKWETKTTETNSFRELKVLILKRNKSLKINAVQLQKHCLRREESSKNFKRTMMMITASYLISNKDQTTSKFKMKQHRKIRSSSLKIFIIKPTSLKKLLFQCKQVLIMLNKSREMASKKLLIMLKP